MIFFSTDQPLHIFGIAKQNDQSRHKEKLYLKTRNRIRLPRLAMYIGSAAYKLENVS